ncbi:hypothetical protein C5167_015540 [Papaver somniferum]|uniref:Uncharacterized protein n=1 Tax=Papaver somniferum TaxID=3469 RepID=A0A4Y7J692_PAPSO|nr:hypothetical protein C5167_015540 [Papaver somniferum]
MKRPSELDTIHHIYHTLFRNHGITSNRIKDIVIAVVFNFVDMDRNKFCLQICEEMHIGNPSISNPLEPPCLSDLSLSNSNCTVIRNLQSCQTYNSAKKMQGSSSGSTSYFSIISGLKLYPLILIKKLDKPDRWQSYQMLMDERINILVTSNLQNDCS